MVPAQSPDAEAPDLWPTSEVAEASGDTETVEQASIFTEFDKIDARRRADAGAPPLAAGAEDPLARLLLQRQVRRHRRDLPRRRKGREKQGA